MSDRFKVKTIADLEKWVDTKIAMLREVEEMGLLSKEGIKILDAFKELNWHIQFSNTLADLKETLDDCEFLYIYSDSKAFASFIRFMEKQ